MLDKIEDFLQCAQMSKGSAQRPPKEANSYQKNYGTVFRPKEPFAADIKIYEGAYLTKETKTLNDD